MNNTLYSLNLLGTHIGLAVAGVVGFFFGSFSNVPVLEAAEN